MLQSRRRFLKASLATGGVTILAGCNALDSGTSDIPSGSSLALPAKSVDIIPSQDVLVVTLRFTEPVESKLEDVNKDPVDLVTLTPTAAQKSVVHIDEPVGDAHELRVDIDGIVTNTNTGRHTIVSSPELQVDPSITPAGDADWETLFTFSVEPITKAASDVSGPAEMYEFPFRQTYTELESVSASAEPNVNEYTGIWATEGYSMSEFPTHELANSLPDRSVPEVAYLNDSRLVSIKALSAAKRGLWNYLLKLLHAPENAVDEAWEDTRGLVKASLEAAAGTQLPTDAQGVSDMTAETYAKAVFGATGDAMGAANSVMSMLKAKEKIEKAGDEYADSLFNTVEKSEIAGALADAIDIAENGRKLHSFEETTILPSILLSEPSNAARVAAHRCYDKHLDTERAVLYELVDRIQSDTTRTLSTMSFPYNRALLYNTTQSSGPEFVDVSDGQAKLNGDVMTDVEIAAVSEQSVTISEENSVVDDTRFDVARMGYDAPFNAGENQDHLLDGVNTLKPVGQVYASLGDVSGSAFSEDPDFRKKRLKTAKHLVYILDTVDLLLSIMRVQQQSLQVTTRPFADPLTITTDKYIGTLTQNDIESRAVLSVIQHAGGPVDAGTEIQYGLLSKTEGGYFEFDRVNAVEQRSGTAFTIDRDYTQNGKRLNVTSTVSGDTHPSLIDITSTFTNTGDGQFILGHPSKNIHEGNMLLGSPHLTDPVGEYRFHIADVGTYSFAETQKWQRFDAPDSVGETPPFVTIFDDERAISYAYVDGPFNGKIVLVNAADGNNGPPAKIDYMVDDVVLAPANKVTRRVVYAIHDGGKGAPEHAADLFTGL